jgi:hypothetical protein
MLNIPILDELLAIRRRISEECQNDPIRYGAMLRDFGKTLSGPTIDKPFSDQAPADARAEHPVVSAADSGSA